MEQKTLSVVKTATQTVSQKTIEDYLFSSNTKLTDQQKKLFIQIALANNLNPFNREIYPIVYGNSFKVVTGYQIYIKKAETSGKLDGWKVVSDGKTATITIWRKDFLQSPFEWTVQKADFDKGTANWKSMGDFMLKKVCIAQGFRLAFPNEISTLPYLAEELENDSTATGTGQTIHPEGKQPESKPANDKPLIRKYTRTANQIPDEPKEINLRNLYRQTMQVLGNDHLRLEKLLQEQNFMSFNDLTLNQAYGILTLARKQQPMEVNSL